MFEADVQLQTVDVEMADQVQKRSNWELLKSLALLFCACIAALMWGLLVRVWLVESAALEVLAGLTGLFAIFGLLYFDLKAADLLLRDRPIVQSPIWFIAVVRGGCL